MSIEKEIAEFFGTQPVSWNLTGSIIVTGVEAKDTDFFVEVKDGKIIEFHMLLKKLGYKLEQDTKYEGQSQCFYSWRKGENNFLVTDNPTFANKHRAATDMLRKEPEKYQTKEARVALFQKVLYGR